VAVQPVASRPEAKLVSFDASVPLETLQLATPVLLAANPDTVVPIGEGSSREKGAGLLTMSPAPLFLLCCTSFFWRGLTTVNNILSDFFLSAFLVF